MSKKIYSLFVVSIIFLLLAIKSFVYGYSGSIDKEVASWNSDFTTAESTEENMKKWEKELVSKLNSTFNYDGETVKEKMAMKTKIYITKDDGDSCTIRIRR